MGIEDFAVRLSAGTRRSREIADRIEHDLRLERKHDIAPDGSLLLQYEDERHIVEMAVSEGEEARISMRMALCQPSTVDPTFADLVIRVATLFGASVSILEDVEADDRSLGWEFSANELDDLREAILQRIPKKRLMWQAAFGERPAKLTCRQAIDQYIIRTQQS